MLILKSKYLLPISSSPFEDGGILIDDGIIIDIDKFDVIKQRNGNVKTKDIGEAIIVPGFVNVHSHAEYSVFRGFIREKPFFEWIKSLICYHKYLTREEFEISAKLGILRMLSTGITTLADSTYSGVTFDILKLFGLKGIVFQEVFGPDDQENQGALDDLKRKVEKMQEEAEGTKIKIGVSPHTIYTVSEGLLLKVCEYAAENDLPVSIHVAETKEESEFIRYGRGIIAENFKKRGIPWKAKGKSVIEYLREIGLFETGCRFQFVHLTQINELDIEILSEHDVSAALCPCSNAMLGVGISPISGIIKGRINVGFGTDSMASNGDLCMFEEMRAGLLLQRGKSKDIFSIKTDQMVKYATLNGAKCLSLDRAIGSLEKGKSADLIAISTSNLNSVPIYNLYDHIVLSIYPSDVIMTMVDGKVLYENGEFPYYDMSEVIEQIEKISNKLRNAIF